MAILKLLLLSLIPACYSPDLRDCTVSCVGAADCTGGQVCSAEHYCAASGVSCAMVAPPLDAPRADMMTLDAPPPIDAPPATGDLHVRIMDKGDVEVSGVGTCAHDCTYTVLLGGELELVAQPDKDHRFDRWTSEACSGQDATCILVPTQPLTEVSAKFRKDD
jgi:hypothetical protein